MISKAQTKRYHTRPSPDRRPTLNALEKGLLRWTMAERGDKVLDVNLRNGLMLESLQRERECEVCGVSDDMEGVRESRSRLRNADILYAQRDEIPWKENTFDSVYAQVLTTPVTEPMLREMERVLKPGGQMLVGFRTVPTPFRQVAALFRPEVDDELYRPSARARILSMMQSLGLTQITWQRTDLIHSVGIGWKPMEA